MNPNGNESCVLEYGARAPVLYGSLREQTGENGFPRTPAGNVFLVLTEISEGLRKPPGAYGRM